MHRRKEEKELLEGAANWLINQFAAPKKISRRLLEPPRDFLLARNMSHPEFFSLFG